MALRANVPTIATAQNAASPLTIPTYDGSGQLTHPDIYDAGAGNTWNGYRYWMSMTPYPTNDNDYENPSIIASNDGEAWVVPDGLTNPIESMPVGGYNSDSDLIYYGGSLYLFFRQSLEAPTNADSIYYYVSSDGVNWGAKTLALSGGISTLVSPAILHNGDNWAMWYVNVNNPKFYIVYRQLAATLAGGFGAAQTCLIYNMPAGKNIWHIDVILVDGEYRMLAMLTDAGSNGVGGILYYAKSADGISFYLSNSPLLQVSASGWDSNRIYRATMTDALDTVWYGGVSDANEWRIGKTGVSL